MLERKSYPNPPLVEVYCEFLFGHSEELPWDAFRLSDFYQRLGGTGVFPERRESGGFKRALRSDGRRRGVKGSASGLWQFISGDGNTVVQVGENTLVVNQLPPYYGWDRFLQTAELAARSYLGVWPPAGLEGAGLHYIDSVDIPGETIVIEEYFNCYPVVPDELTMRSMTDFSMSCDVEGEEPGDVLAFTIRQQESESTEPRVTFRLTWDYRVTEPSAADLGGMLAFLNRAHTRTSEAFRASITKKCEALFEGE